MTSELRQHPRFSDERPISVRIEGEEAVTLQLVDVSKGGMFIHFERPPILGTRLEIEVPLEESVLHLTADVVHVVDVDTASAFGQPPGMGVQFFGLSKKAREDLDEYVDGLEALLSLDLRPDVGFAPLDDLLEEARRVSRAFRALDIYEALGVSPSESVEAVFSKIDRMRKRFAHVPVDDAPLKAARLEQLGEQLERAADLFRNTLRRLHYDFQRGHLRVEERREAGEDFAYLQEVWSHFFPNRVRQGASAFRKARICEKQDDFEGCRKHASEALEYDPFNARYHRAMAKWEVNEQSRMESVDLVPKPEPDVIASELRSLARKIEAIDHFELLGVSRDAENEAVTKAYLTLVRRYRPRDMEESSPKDVLYIAHALQNRLQVAYRTLVNPSARAVYLAQCDATTDACRGRAAKAKYEAGVAYLRRNNCSVARRFFEAAAELDPKPEYQAKVAWSMISDPEYDRGEALRHAVPLLESAIAQVGGRDVAALAHYLYYMGKLFVDCDQLDRAAECLEKAAGFDAKLAEACMALMPRKSA